MNKSLPYMRVSTTCTISLLVSDRNDGNILSVLFLKARQGLRSQWMMSTFPGSKVHVANMGPTWVLWAPVWPHEPCYQGCDALLASPVTDLGTEVMSLRMPSPLPWHQVWQVEINIRDNTDGLVQERRTSIAHALEVRLSSTNPTMW